MFGRQPTGDLILDYRLKYASSYLRERAQSHRVHHPRLLERLREQLYSGLETQGPCPAAPHSPEDRQQVNRGWNGGRGDDLPALQTPEPFQHLGPKAAHVRGSGVIL